MKRLRKSWRRLEVRVQKSAAVQGALQSLYARYIAFCYRTTRWRRIGFQDFEADIAAGRPRVLVTWHARLSLITYLRVWDDHTLVAIASDHADARIITKDLRRRDVEMILVPTSGSRSAGVREAVRALRDGKSVGITVDGPMGPAKVAKPGAVVIAGLAGAEVTPCSFAVNRAIRLKTWDRFVLPLPFGRGVLGIGAGFRPPSRLTEEALTETCARTERLIAAVTAECEAALR